MPRLYRIKFPGISLDDLISLKKRGISIRKVRFGITPDEYGRTYTAGKYTFIVKASPKEIEAALKKVRRE